MKNITACAKNLLTYHLNIYKIRNKFNDFILHAFKDLK